MSTASVTRGDRRAGEESDLALVRRVQAGDTAALGVLYERYRRVVYRTALAITRDERIAEDVLQECFVRLYTYAYAVDVERPLLGWLYRVTVHLAYDHIPSRRWREAALALDEILEWLTNLPSAFPLPEHEAEERDMAQMVRELIAALPASHQVVIVLFYLENMPLEAIAEVLELPVGTVKSRLHYARARLRDMLSRRQRPVPEMTYEFT